jgi:8-oxo-dGTP pyrophosphatase MutT (NUDIX family)
MDLTDGERAEIVRRAIALNIPDVPERALHALGRLRRADGSKIAAYVVHAMDAIITDGTWLVVIDRKNPPGQGKPAFPGGFLDPQSNGRAEDPVHAAIRETMEEAGIALTGGTLVGRRNFDRPFDVRIAWHDLPAYGIGQGDAFLVSTQGVRFDVPDLTALPLHAGDDALPGSARLVALADLTREKMGVPDHYGLLETALGRK